MKATLDFSADLLVTLKKGGTPSDGFFYLRCVRIANDEGGLLTSSFVLPDGNTCFWEESVETSWSESENANEYIVSISGSGVGLEVDENDYPEICSFIAEADAEDPEVLEDVFRVEVAFKHDGDAGEDLVAKQSCESVFEARVELCNDDRWNDLGFD